VGAPTRRRGLKLEAALLQAAWDELTAVGYAAFTMEGVASRARTGRAVLYRRWPSRPELVLAALRRHATLDSIPVPDTGSLREDLLELLRYLSARSGEIAGIFSFLIADSFKEGGQSLSVLRERVLATMPKTGSMVIIERAVARGEIDPRRLSPRICALPADLVRHDLIMTQMPVPDATLVEIVDHIFLPLVRPCDR
jgi:AcrR family transcriptional regulator